MKKATKYTLITLGIALFIFLMLPFLETPTLSAAKQKNSFVPQIFTANPLAKIAERIARLFGKKSPSPRAAAYSASAAGSPAPADNALTIARADVSDLDVEDDDIPAAPDPDEENAQFFLQGEDGEWVLVRQRMPDAAQSGMHEISIKDDAYDRYIRQERSARFTPTATQHKTAAVPDSKLARLFNPVKRFFGMGGATAAQSGALAAGGETQSAAARRGSSSGGMGRNTDKQARQLPGAQDVHSAFGNGHVSTVTGVQLHDRDSRLSDLIDTDQVIQDAADLVAESVQDPRTRQRTRREQENKYAALTKARLQADLLQRGGENPPQDALPETAHCDVVKGMITPSEGSCFPPSYLDEAQELREGNKQFFQERTGETLPPTQLTPVLGITHLSSAQQLEPTDLDKQDPSTLYTKEIYRYMLQKNNCGSNDCFWVTNTVQTSDEDYQTLQASVVGAGVDFGGDPLQKYPALKNQFVAAQVKKYQQENPQATEDDIQKFTKDVQLAAPPYVLYTKQDLTLLTRQLKNKGAANGQPQPAIYFADAADAKVFAETYGFDVPFFYGTSGHQLFAASGEITLEQRSRTLITDLTDNVLVRQQIQREIKEDASRTAVTNTATPIVEAIQEQAAQDIANFTKTLDLGKTQK